MNKNNAKDYLPLVQALADGKTIQVKLSSSWADANSPNFDNYKPSDFRIKPEPIVAYVTVGPDDSELGYAYASFDEAKRVARTNTIYTKVIKMVQSDE